MKFLDYFQINVTTEHAETPAPRDKKYSLQAPRRRSMNDDIQDDFVAIDFETMTSCLTSACAIGMAKVIDGEIVQEFYSLINPIRDKHTDKEPNRKIHGISLVSAEKANTFAELFEGVRLFISGLPIVCHNKSADIAILEQLMDFYGLSGINTSTAICTYSLTGKSLSECCKEYGIKKERHHNALWDAEACAKIYLELIGKPIINQGGSPIFGKNSPMAATRNIDKTHRHRLDDDQIKEKDSIFYNSTVVITGVFEGFESRDELALRLQSLGAKITSSISKKTTHVLVGSDAGPKKIEKIRQLQAEGHPIVLLREHEFEKLI
ncbi:exonuclease domain-containing protein [uncultured Muribaculum sp.]|uniref:exonuclease domain-containing protein n=1 Tax=uncultured Muribaculum sp. TaxID=1918613 RepID=UPI0026705604|nr:exonuclease domain-containing protein [uncultured Muribaculum sp.]